MSDPIVVGKVGGVRNPILITLSELDAGRIVDIRRYFLDKASNELKPTQKGIAVQGANFNELMECLSERFGQISVWLEEGSQTDQAKRSRALTQAALSSSPSKIKRENWRGASFFSVESVGASVEVTFNSQHAVDDQLSRVSSKEGAEQLLADVLAAFRVACLSSTVDKQSLTVDLGQLESTWGLLLAQMLKKRQGK